MGPRSCKNLIACLAFTEEGVSQSWFTVLCTQALLQGLCWADD